MKARRWLTWLGALVVGGGFVFPPFAHGALRTAVFLAALVGLTVLREVGCLLFGLILGLRPRFFELGDGEVSLRGRVFGVSWHLKEFPIGSATIWEPPADDRWLRVRVWLLAFIRPAVTLGVVLAIRALDVPLRGDAGSAWLLQTIAQASIGVLVLSLIPFSLSAGIVPFESDGLRLGKIPFATAPVLREAFAYYYLAAAHEALLDDQPNTALAMCEEGLRRYGGLWHKGFERTRGLVIARLGDHTRAIDQAEEDLRQEQPPLLRALTLNNWAWYAFLRRRESDLRLADQRSAEALSGMPERAALLGTRGAILLWRGQVADAITLLERSLEGTSANRGAPSACLLAMAWAARGDRERARVYLERARRGGPTDGLLPEAESLLERFSDPVRVIRAVRGHRALVIEGDEIHLVDGARKKPASLGECAWIGLSKRKRALLALRREGRSWRLPLDVGSLFWARLVVRGWQVGRSAIPDAQALSSDGGMSIETRERIYQQQVLGRQQLTVSTPWGITFLASAAAFAASMLFFTSWRWLAWLMPILLLHELGHWVAMRAFGHADARISFVPFLGAATFTKIPFRKRWQEIVMLLAGPVPGIVIGLAIVLSPLRRFEHAMSAAGLLLILNLLNLLPLHPLDGGRIMHALVTAGRPRFDLALKTLATLAFIAIGFAVKEPFITLIGVVGLLFWRRAYRLAKLEVQIRRMPGFDPGLPAKERRAFVFQALDATERNQDWATTVASLDMPVGYRRPPLWASLLWASVFAAPIVGIGVVTAGFQRTMGGRKCPQQDTAPVVICGGSPTFPDVPSTGASGERAQFGAAAFVWCTAPDTVMEALANRLKEAQAASDYCAAWPWEQAATGTEESRRKARVTFLRFERAVLSIAPEKRLDRLDRLLKEVEGWRDLDVETVRLFRRSVDRSGDADQDDEIEEALGDRLGRSANATCDRFSLTNLAGGRRPREGHAEAVSFSLRMKAASDFVEVGSYLCGLGCRLQVLPVRPEDRRLAFCF